VETEDRYVDALLAELELRMAPYQGRLVETIYFGGGTPALLRPDSLARLIEAIEGAFPNSVGTPGGDSIEITLEMNPDSVERNRIPRFAEVGINRVSLGVQSFDDRILKRLGRAHGGREAHATLDALAVAGLENVSIDLMFGVPEQDLARWSADIDAALDRGLPHLSAYELVIEEGTPFSLAASRGQIRPMPEGETADLLAHLIERLGGAGLERYELTNFARPGRESRHNDRYWRRAPVLGLGVGAHSHLPPGAERPHGARPANTRHLSEYFEAARSRRSPVVAEGLLDRSAAISEAFFLALRRRAGLDAREFQREFGELPAQVHGEAIDGLCRRGLLAQGAQGDLRLTERGWELADEVFTQFV
jgi:oxygen-independent coproporphyrinogen-3 oxidase